MSTSTEHSTTHGTFVIERTYPASAARVFGAFADPAVKSRWFNGGDVATTEYELDFRIGGREFSRGAAPDGQHYTYEARYEDIIPEQRIVTTYTMYLEQTRISVSVNTFELRPADGGTRLTFTEQGAFLDGFDTPAEREHGTRELLDALGRLLAQPD